ncbi:hypothetical protein HYH03_007063 [Edaphochlamys debaryana]|uniref:Uncharacterized protein n=1 Tax=Edaphochlamys debaryana TaxID=47281 RepID=A0A835Y2N3_9CHLO|nr:hypothetical protein HYH03_007063 [Edaphochlamys debaryana]|eukprot:KAG2494821.1 hypothetical protein HYH03_007063 [Edaphochlamys debaryana]
MLLRTLDTMIWGALAPAPDVRTAEYSEYLTSKVKNYTIGWHIFRTVTEGMFLVSNGFAFNTIVVQLFWSMSVGSVLLYFFRRPTWLRLRERLCVGINIVYGTITVLKIYNLVPRLPNENNYLFKHCFLTMADAAFSQTAVHKQYVVMFSEALVRCIVWRRYNVLLDLPMPAVIAVSVTWQVWLLCFASMLQSGHVEAFRRARSAGTAASGSGSGSAASASTSAASTSTAAASAAAPEASAAAPEACLPAPETEAAAEPAPAEPAPAAKAAPTELPAAASAGPWPVIESARLAPPLRRDASREAARDRPQRSHRSSVEAAPPLSPGASSRDSRPMSPAQARYMRALRSLTRGPSSYVLLTHHRKQAPGPAAASLQFYLPSASPEQLQPGGQWRDKLAAAIAEGAPGWQVVGACVRKGSLIVHVDLVYQPPAASTLDSSPEACSSSSPFFAPPGAACGSSHPSSLPSGTPYQLSPEASLGRGAAPGGCLESGSGGAGFMFTGAGTSEPPFRPSTDAVDGFVAGMSAEALLELLGLPAEPQPPTAAAAAAAVSLGTAVPMSVQRGGLMAHLGSRAAAETAVKCDRGELRDVCGLHTSTPTPTLLPRAAHAPASPWVAEEEEEGEGVAGGVVDGCKPTGLAAAGADISEVMAAEEPAVVEAKGGEVAAEKEAAPALDVPASKAGPSTSSSSPTSEPEPAGPNSLGAHDAVQLPPRATLADAVWTAIAPPAELRSREYLDFVAHRVAGIQMSYSGFMVIMGLCFWIINRGVGVHPGTMTAHLGAEVLSLLAVGLGGSGAWRRHRVELVYAGVAARTLQMLGCILGFMPHMLRDSDCESGRWVQKVVLIGTLQAVCMQPPVLSFMLVRLPALLLCIHIHVNMCRTHLPLVYGIILHAGLEASIFMVLAVLQHRHLEAFRLSRAATKSHKGAPSASATSATAAAGLDTAAAAAAAAATARSFARRTGSSCGFDVTASLPTFAAGTTPAAAVDAAAGSAAAAAYTASPFTSCAAPSDPTDVHLSCPVIAIGPRRVASLRLDFTVAPCVLDELQVVLRHVGPTAVASGLHTAHSARDVSHSLVAPAAAAAAPANQPAPFAAELSICAAQSDAPGVVHVELWRGRRRVSSSPALLVEAPKLGPEPRALEIVDASVTSPVPGGAATWIHDVSSYTAGLAAQGHGAAAAAFVEELGTWLSQVAALERGLRAADQRVANVLYFHGNPALGGEYLFLKPTHAGGGGGGAAAGGSGGGKLTPRRLSGLDGAGAASADVGIKAMLLSQGSMLLAVAAEAGCCALAAHLLSALTAPGALACPLAAVLEAARTPLTQLPLLHAAVRSGCEAMVDLTVSWMVGAGATEVWSMEAAVQAISLAPGPGADGPDVSGASGAGFRRSLVRQLSAAARAGREEAASRTATAAAGLRVRPVERDLTAGTATSAATAATAASAPDPTSGGDRFHGTPAAAVNALSAASAGATTAAATDAAAAAAAADGVADAPDEDLGAFRIVSFQGLRRASPPPPPPPPAPPAAAAAAEPRVSKTGAASDDLGAAQAAPVSEGAGAKTPSGPASAEAAAMASLIDGGVLVVTPLHLALALEDGGRMATHIVRTYPEAFEAWRRHAAELTGGAFSGLLGSQTGSSTPPMIETIPEHATSSPNNVVPLYAGLSSTRASSTGPPATSHSGLTPSTSSQGQPFPAANASALVGAGRAYASVPGLGGGGGGVYGTGRDSMDGDTALNSMSLSEVAFLEGVRWVDEETDCTRGNRVGGFKITKM